MSTSPRPRSLALGGVTNLSVLAPVKRGFVDGFEPITYQRRLERLLVALQAARQNVRESELRAPVFPDSVGRFGIIRSFRYAIVPPERTGRAGDPEAPSLLSLNVSFDGGWEPYMRVIYRDIGTLLDALFCHCETDYPGSRDGSFDAYCRWVRRNEVAGGLFYVDPAPVTVSDQAYLAEIERLQRDGAADARMADHAIAPDVRARDAAIAAVIADPSRVPPLLRTLKGLYRLSVYFPANAGDERGILVRFAQSVLQDFVRLLADPRFAAQAAAIRALLPDEMNWLALPQPAPVRPDRAAFDPAALQDAILNRDDPVTHGAVVLLRVRDPALALTHLAALADHCGPPTAPDAPRHHVALSAAGLRALGFTPERLETLPQEFLEGMEARAGLLGDMRGNHPDRWRRPPRAGGAAGEGVDLGVVHVVVVLRLADPADTGVALNPKLQPAIDALVAPATGLALLSVQATRSGREHFGFVDGLSQPRVAANGVPAARDEVRAGELVLGFANDRGDGPHPRTPDTLLDHGSFLVVRKLRQRLDHVGAALAPLADPTAALERLMGRRQDGLPPVPHGAGGLNDFDYASDPNGRACPFASHIRRANPRDGRPYTPRLLRRGMSYGPRDDGREPAEGRGIVFMAYCASIAEQFETVQRWLSGGNSSGVGSAQADPFLGVPDGKKRSFRYADAGGAVQRIDLGEQPFVELEWGLYLFVPSLAALRALAAQRTMPTSAMPPPAPPATSALDAWRRRLEYPDQAPATWAEVRAQAGGRLEAPPYGTLIGRAPEVLAVLQDDGSRYSVEGYGLRMDVSIGRNVLGMDSATGHDAQAPAANAVVEGIDEATAFAAASPIVHDLLARLPVYDLGGPGGAPRRSLDLVSFSDGVLAALCTAWFGLPDGVHMVTGGRIDGAVAPPRCPGHLLGPSRFTFTPHPNDAVRRAGIDQGPIVLQAVKDRMAAPAAMGPLAEDVRSGLGHLGNDVVARTIAGLLLGFPPTVQGNFLRTMERWIDGAALWTLQQVLADARGAEPEATHAHARTALRQPLLDAMRVRPVPEVLWRCPVEGDPPASVPERRVVLGITSALTDPGVPHELMFGGSRDPASALYTVHACPGYGMGVGVMLAMLAGILCAGTLRPTGSPVLLMVAKG